MYEYLINSACYNELHCTSIIYVWKKLSILRGCKTLHPKYDNGRDDNNSYALNLVVKIEFVLRRVKSS